MNIEKPTVSICLPNLDNLLYLPERLKSIYEQTFSDWELIVVDGYSKDGAWEFFVEHARLDARIKISQAPRGLYASWNNCIRQAKGEYIYFATSDDTMLPDCLAKMVNALKTHPECGICQCSLELIDELGNKHPLMDWNGFPFPRFANEWLDRPHIRQAPLDGMLHCALETVYTSITQLLIRKHVFDRVGLFDENLGAIADFEWGMRVGMLQNCIFIPEKLAAWRLHSKQVSNDAEAYTVRSKILSMVRIALARAKELSPQTFAGRPTKRLLTFYRRQIILLGLARPVHRLGRIKFLLCQALHGNIEAVNYLLRRKDRHLFQQTAQFDMLRALLEELKIPNPQFL